MSRFSPQRVARLLFGTEGSVSVDVEVQVMTVASAILATGVVLVSPLLSDLTGPFAVSTQRMGLLITGFTAPPIVLIPVMGVIADRIGRKPVLVPGLAVYGLAGAGVGLSTSFQGALALRVIQGIGFAAAMPLTITMLGDLYRGNREATAQGMRTAGNFFSNMITPTIAGLLLVGSWRYPFFIFLLAVPVAVWVWLTLPEPDPAQQSSIRGYLFNLLDLFRRPIMALTLSSFVLRFALFYGYLTYISVLAIQDVGLSAVATGILVSIKSVGSILGSTQVGRISPRWSLSLIVAGSFVLSGLGVAISGLVPVPWVLVGGAALLGIGDGVCAPVQKSLVNRLAPTRLRGGAISSTSTFQNIGKAGVPVVLGGVLAAYGSDVAFVVLGVVGGGLGALTMMVVWALANANDR